MFRVMDPSALTSPATSVESRIGIKRALAKACLLELAQRASQRKEMASVRRERHRTVLKGEGARAFPSPNPRAEAGHPPQAKDSSSQRHLVPAMVLPRWESLETFSAQGVEDSKLHLLSIAGTAETPALACTVCAKLLNGGEAILALACVHVFCPVCFEAFLRRRWAELASNQVDGAETEQIPCPKCGISLQREDVHTLTEAEVQNLVDRATLTGAAAPSVDCSWPSGCAATPSALFAAGPDGSPASVIAQAKAAAAAASQVVVRGGQFMNLTPTCSMPGVSPSSASSGVPLPILPGASSSTTSTVPGQLAAPGGEESLRLLREAQREKAEPSSPAVTVPAVTSSVPQQVPIHSPGASSVGSSLGNTAITATMLSSPAAASKVAANVASGSGSFTAVATGSGSFTAMGVVTTGTNFMGSNHTGSGSFTASGCKPPEVGQMPPFPTNGTLAASVAAGPMPQSGSYKQQALNAPGGPLSPAAGYRPYAVNHQKNGHSLPEKVPTMPHRSVSMPIQPGDPRSPQTQLSGVPVGMSVTAPSQPHVAPQGTASGGTGVATAGQPAAHAGFRRSMPLDGSGRMSHAGQAMPGVQTVARQLQMGSPPSYMAAAPPSMPVFGGTTVNTMASRISHI